MIWEDKHKNGTLHLNLRRKGKKYNKRGNLIHTITADNGKEFAKHQEIAKELDISFYFVNCTILGNVVLMRTAPKRDLVISHQTRLLNLQPDVPRLEPNFTGVVAPDVTENEKKSTLKPKPMI